MNTTYKGRGQMQRAIEHILRRKAMPICIQCGEERSPALMSKENQRICQACWDDYDMGRFAAPEGAWPAKDSEKEEVSDEHS